MNKEDFLKIGRDTELTNGDVVANWGWIIYIIKGFIICSLQLIKLE